MTYNTLENSNIRLRALEPSDIDLLFAWENDMSIWQVSNTLAPFSRYALKRYIQNAQLDIYQTKQLRLMIERKVVEPEAVGLVDLFDFDAYNQRAGVGILIADPEKRRLGLAYEAVETITNYAFNTLALKQLYCNINTNNLASLKLFKKCGYETSGIKKSWLRTAEGWNDVEFLQKLNPNKRN